MSPSAAILAVLGLGNPGPEYRNSRHNIGFLVVRRLAERHRVRLQADGPDLHVAGWRFGGGGRVIRLAQPMTYMNRSGRGAARLRRAHGVDPSEMLVVVDDLDLPFGQLRLRETGGPGTHNGMRSLVDELGEGFPRLRVGIGPAPEGVDLAEWVLEPFSAEEEERLPAVIEAAADCVEIAARQGVREGMNRFNGMRPGTADDPAGRPGGGR